MIQKIEKDSYQYYNRWAGNPEGVRENKKLCVEEVSNTDGWHSHQCTRLRGYWIDRLFCKQHAKNYPQDCGDKEG